MLLETLIEFLRVFCHFCLGFDWVDLVISYVITMMVTPWQGGLKGDMAQNS